MTAVLRSHHGRVGGNRRAGRITEVSANTDVLIDGFSPGFGFTGIAVAVLETTIRSGSISYFDLLGAMDAGALNRAMWREYPRTW